MGIGIGRKVYIPEDPSFKAVMAKAFKESRNIDRKVTDYCIEIGSRNDMSFTDNNRLSFRIGRDYYEYALTPWALAQLCHKIGIPVNYFRSLLRKNNPECKALAKSTINTMLKYNNDNMMIRTYGDKARGILSGSYKCFDTTQILQVIQKLADTKSFLGLKNMECKEYYLDEEFFVLSFIYKEPLQGLRDKDLHLGIRISSSDVGKSAIHVDSWVYKELCTNGLYAYCNETSVYYQRHVNVTPNNVRDKIETVLLRYPEIMDKVVKDIKKAEDFSLANSVLLKEGEDEKTYAGSIREAVAKKLELTNGQMDTIAQIAKASYTPDLWGYVNAITEYAHELSAYNRIMLENKAGRFMTEFDKLFGLGLKLGWKM